MDLNIILQIAKYWWKSESHPYPSKATLAASIGVTSRTIQKRIQEMEKAGFIQRVERRDGKGSKSNIYQLTPLAKELIPYSKNIVEERNKRRSEDSKRPKLRGKPKAKPKLVSVGND